ncbi:MAG: putative CDP-diacylglycerol--inositol 3-phosphatidyltransferase [Streblomastix strix]|uniref:Putative CDP-diacylglycerol--inositol 3-phosphatidyltransferase n=1 Tax=Streblomastix strix TaxID=222440 RepID=A0A5J4VZM1_9EUKA|nr:MAG: putative CDP-diacylglycerol--inositol 3-phosphatidyltransferase [Streblomastix strix]
MSQITSTQPDFEPRKIWLYVPNIIGYIRIALSFIAVVFYQFPSVFISCYLIAFILDWADGFFARKYNQCSKFGALLDMFIDRGSIATLLCTLSALYPQFQILFSIFLFFDITSHWVRTNFTLQSNLTSHKNTDSPNTQKLLRIYYTNRPIMAFICIGHEVFFLLLYLLFFVDFLPESVSNVFESILEYGWSITHMGNVYNNSSATSQISSQQFIGHWNRLYQKLGSSSFLLRNGVIGFVTFSFFFSLFWMVLKFIVHIQQLISGMQDMQDFENGQIKAKLENEATDNIRKSKNQ